MNRFDFTPYRRNTVGFDRLFELLENTGRAATNENYPPFNIERTGENDYQVTVAVAGFKSDEIDIVAQQQLRLLVRPECCLRIRGSAYRSTRELGSCGESREERLALHNLCATCVLAPLGVCVNSQVGDVAGESNAIPNFLCGSW